MLTIEEARKSGKGVVVRFQEKENYKLAVNGFDCPHCNAGGGRNKENREISSTVNKDTYETPIDIDFMHNEEGYSWTEDCKCANCGKMYSQHNGC